MKASRVLSRKTAIALGIVVLLALGVAAALFYAYDPSLSFARRSTGLALSGAKVVHFDDDTEISARLIAIVTEGEALALEARAGDPPENVNALFLRPELLDLPTSGQRYLSGCERSAWVALLDPESRTLRLEMLYPDPGGDAPPCPPEPSTP